MSFSRPVLYRLLKFCRPAGHSVLPGGAVKNEFVCNESSEMKLSHKIFIVAGMIFCQSAAVKAAEAHRVNGEIVDLYLGNDWKMLEAAEAPENWMKPEFDDRNFTAGSLTDGVYYAAGNRNCETPTFYRQQVEIPAEWQNRQYTLQLQLPEGARLYIDGVAVDSAANAARVELNDWIRPGENGLIAVCYPAGNRRLYNYRNVIRLTAPEVTVGLSTPLPRKGQPVTVRRLNASRPDLTITAPSGQRQQLTFKSGNAIVWTPLEYGLYTLSDGEKQTEVFVTATPLQLHLWDGTIYSRYATTVMGDPQAPDNQSYRQRGVKLVAWAGGEYLGRESLGAERLLVPEQWVENWKSTLDYDGMALDELYLGVEDSHHILPTLALPLFEELVPEDYEFGVYFCGVEPAAVAGGWLIRSMLDDRVVLLEECYSFGYPVWWKRWSDISMQRFEQSTLLSLATGILLDKPEPVDNATYTVDKLRETVAMARRIAPHMAGISFFNAYNRGDLDAWIDQVFEEYFLGAVVYFEPHGGQLRVWNIGQSDAGDVTILFQDESGTVLNRQVLNRLTPDEFVTLTVPPQAGQVGIEQPEKMTSLYAGNVFRLPADLDPLQVEYSSIANGSTLERLDGNVRLAFRFSKPLDPATVKSENVSLNGAATGPAAVTVEYDPATLTLVVAGKLPEDYYSLFLRGGETGLRAEDGSRLDGSGNGFIEMEPECYLGVDDYPLHFIFRHRI